MKIGVFGTGAYGLALSSILVNNGCQVTMWTKFIEEKDLLEKNRCNDQYLPGYVLDDSITITTNVEECINTAELLILAIPASFIESLCIKIKPFINGNHILIASKGIEQKTGLFISEIISNNLNTKNIGVISGPTFASDIITKLPAGLSLASKSAGTIALAKKALENNYIKLRETDDMLGIEICGSVKNIIALASGILDGLGATESTKALFLSEATIDIENILEQFNCSKQTVLSYAGIGDLFLTCTSDSSRNFTFGRLIGSKSSKEDIDAYLEKTTVEGYYTLKVFYKLLKNKNISIPVIDIIYETVINMQDSRLLLDFLIQKQ